MKPRIRLKGFEGEWEPTTFGRNVKLRRGLTYSPTDVCPNGIRVLRSSNIDEDTFVVSKDDVFVNDKCVNIPFANQGDILITAANGSPRLVGKHCLIKTDDMNMVHGGFMLLASSPESAFYNASMGSGWYTSFKRIGISGGNGAIGNLDKTELENFTLYIPNSRCERDGLANYFKSLDALIQSTTQKVASLKQLKEASLISMFPQGNETTPRVRFMGFEGEWKKVCFKNVTYLSGIKNINNLPLESYSISNESGFVPQNEQFEKGGSMANANKRLYYIVSPDSFAYNPARINIGSIGYYNSNNDVIISSLYVVFKTDDATYNPFLNYWFKTKEFQKQIELYQEGGVRLYFFYDKLCNCYFRRPCFEEQQHIASYFNSLDTQITLQEQRLEKLKQLKSACLDQMFV